VAACDLRHRDRFEQRIAEAVAEDLGDRPDAMRPRLVAAAAVAALASFEDAAVEMLDSDPNAAAKLVEDPAAFFDDGLRFLEAGLAALRS
jgi:hypothetical protein